MLKKIFICLFITSSFTLFSQTATEIELDSVTNYENAKEYVKSKSFKQNKFIVFNEEKHKTRIAKDLFELSLGGTKTYDNGDEKTIYKVLEKKQIPNYRASYVFIDGAKLTTNQISKLRQSIIEKYNDGAAFDFLAKQHSMDLNSKRGGDTGWFANNLFDSDLESIIINDNHDLDDIFTAEVPSKNKYYVILNTFSPKEISEINVLKIVEDLE